jgi:glucan phosphorylase
MLSRRVARGVIIMLAAMIGGGLGVLAVCMPAGIRLEASIVAVGLIYAESFFVARWGMRWLHRRYQY